MKQILSFLIPFLLLITSCKDSSNPVKPSDGDGKITTGDNVNLLSQSIGTGGSTIKVNKADDPLDGMEIVIPPNAFTTSQTFNVSYATIKSHDLGEYFNPISPLIKITNNGDYANLPMKVKIPIVLPAGYFAMGFFYNHTTGELEGMPIEDLSSNSITISTKHFIADKSSSKLNKYFEDVTWASVVVSMIDTNKLRNKNIIDSGFKPGIDDWEFPNYGSYISPGGHCAGQSISAIWYYIEKRKKTAAAQLFHLSDKFNVPTKPDSLWQDNPRGYRFVSTIQEDIGWNNEWYEDLKIQHSKPDITFKAFALSILVTKNPQHVGIAKSTHPNYAHAMVVYKVDYPNKKLYTADPNYPTNRASDGTLTERVIDYTNGVLGPYMSGLNAGDPQTSFDQIGYFSNKAFLQWPPIASRWIEFENGSIGQNRFPSYTLYIDNTSGQSVGDNLNYDKDTLKLVCKSTQSLGSFAGTDHLQWIEVYDENGKRIADTDTLTGILKFKLNPGNNKLGVCIWCRIAPNGRWPYVDFKWITVNYIKPTTVYVTPNPFTGRVNIDYTFTANIDGSVLTNLKYVWYFQYGLEVPSSFTKFNDNTITYKFTKVGTYSVWIYLYDNSNGNLIASSSIIKPTIYAGADIFLTKSAGIYFNADFHFDNPNYGESSFTVSEDYYTYNNQKITWSGNDFIINYNYKTGNTYDSVFTTGKINGSVSGDGNSLISLSAEQYTSTKSAGGLIMTQKITCTNMAFTSFGTYAVQAIVQGPQAANKVSNIQWFGKFKNSSSGQWENYSLNSIDYNSSFQPNLRISFSK